jgi:hypothetical protein
MQTYSARVVDLKPRSVELKDLLSLASMLRGSWQMFVVEGMVGQTPDPQSVEAFEQLTRTSEYGYLFDRQRLCAFAETLEDIGSFVLTHTVGRMIAQINVDRREFVDCDLVVELFDWSEWRVHIRRPSEQHLLLSWLLEIGFVSHWD